MNWIVTLRSWALMCEHADVGLERITLYQTANQNQTKTQYENQENQESGYCR
jgi:hypothetical protein